jgi:hypothetical protein
MVKTVVTPKNNSIYLDIPDNYIGREIEVLLYAKDELQEENVKPKKNLVNFMGVLSENDYQSLKLHTEQARKEWNNI